VGEAGIFFDPDDNNASGKLILEVVDNERLRKELLDKGFNHVKKFSG
jgi:hypothetical protein